MSYKKNILLLILIFLSVNTFGQKLNDFYTSFSENGIKHNLNFDENGIVEIGSIRRHMSPFYDIVGTYHKRGDSIYIEMEKINSLELSKAKKFGLESFSEMKLVLYQNGSELIDIKNQTVYVTSKRLNNKKIKRKSIAFIDNQKYTYERIVTDGYGLIRRVPRKNKRFDKALAGVLENPENYEIKVIRGLAAYEKYGLIGINGVSIMNKKKLSTTMYNNNFGFVSCGHNRASIKVGNFSYLSF